MERGLKVFKDISSPREYRGSGPGLQNHLDNGNFQPFASKSPGAFQCFVCQFFIIRDTMYKDVLKVYRKGLKTVVAGKAEKKNIVTFDV